MVCAIIISALFSMPVLAAEATENLKIESLKGWGWITKDVNSFSKLTLTADSNTTQVGSAYVPNGSQGAYKGKYVVASADGSVTHTYVNEIMYMQWIGMAINPAVDEFIFYVELPDYAKSSDTWGLGIQGMGILQKEVVTNVNPTYQTEFSYLSVYGDTWVTSTTGGGSDRSLKLPSGFKGYVRLNFENLTFDKKADGSEVDLDSAYSLNHINFKFNAVGGDNGNLEFGGIFYVPSNKSNATVMNISNEAFNLTYAKGGKVELDYNDDSTENTVYTDKYVGDVITLPTPEREGYSFDGWYYDDAFANPVGATYTVTAESKTLYANWIKNIEIGDVNADGVIDATDLTVLRKIILEAEADYDAAIADVNGDGEIDVRDLVRLKKSVS